MNKIILEEQVKILGVKNFEGKEKLLDFYIEQPGQDKLYVFSKVFTQNTYNLCRSGVRVNELSCKHLCNISMSEELDMEILESLRTVLELLDHLYGSNE